MDYYYALLDSYALLKKRKFKLSLSEKKEDSKETGLASQMASVQADIKAAFDAGGNQTGLGNGGNINMESSQDEEGNQVVKISGSNIGAKNVSDFGELNFDNEEEFGYKLAAAWLGGEGGEDTDPQDPEEDEEAARLQVEAAIKEQGKTVMQKLADFMAPKVVKELFSGLVLERTKRTLDNLRGIINPAKKNQGYDTRALSSHPLPLDQRIFATDDITDEQKLAALESLQDSLDFLEELHNPEKRGPLLEPEAKKLAEIMGKMGINRHGVSFDGVFFFYQDDSTGKSDPLKNMADQFNVAAAEYNEAWENTDEDIKAQAIIPLIQDNTAKSGGADESYRGPVAEKFMRVSAILLKTEALLRLHADDPDELKEIQEKASEQLGEVFDEVMANPEEFEKLVRVFGRGRMMVLGQIVGNAEALNDAKFYEECHKVLVEELGMDPEKATVLLDNAGQDGGWAHALLVTTFVNQTFDRELFGDDPDMIPDDVIHAGETDSDSSGEKADVILVWDGDDEVCKKVADYYTKRLGSTAKDKDACNSDKDGVGEDQMVTPRKGGGCEMHMELKTLTSSQEKGGAGMSSSSRMTALCDERAKRGDDGEFDPEFVVDNVHDENGKLTDSFGRQVFKGEREADSGVSKASAEYKEANDARLDGCLGKGTSERACEKHHEILKEAQKLIGITSRNSGATNDEKDAAIQMWFEGKTDNEKMRTRRDRARRALTSPNPTKEEEAALAKVHKDMLQAVIKRDIPAGKVKDKDTVDYLSSMMSMAIGSTRETVRTTRGIEDGHQSVYLNNATVQANLSRIKDGTAHFVRSGGTINLIDSETGETLCGCDTARGEFKWTIGKGESSPISGELSDPESKKAKGKAKRKEGRIAKYKERELGLTMGEGLHKKWQEENAHRGTRFKDKNPDGTDLDPKWVADNEPEGGWGEEGPRVDLLATDFEDLPEGWAKENRDAGVDAVKAVNNSNTEEEASAQIHDDWMRRNGEEVLDKDGKSKKPPQYTHKEGDDWQADLFVPYDELSEEEKKKDRVHARDAAERLGKKWGKSTKEDLFITFLKGQQSLLEKLMNQTT